MAVAFTLIGGFLFWLFFRNRAVNRPATYLVASNYKDIVELQQSLAGGTAKNVPFARIVNTGKKPWWHLATQQTTLRCLVDQNRSEIVFAPKYILVVNLGKVIEICTHDKAVITNRSRYLHETKDGSPDRRYNYNSTLVVGTYVGTVVR